MIRIALISDLHLGLRQPDLPSDEKRLLTLEKILGIAREHDLLLVAGDLFDREAAPDLAKTAADMMARILANAVPVIMTPGECEVADTGELHPVLSSLPLARFFFRPDDYTPYEFSRGAETIYIYGHPALADAELELLKRKPGPGLHLGLFHAYFNNSAEDRGPGAFTINKETMKQLGYDFYCLGHQHRFKLYRYQEQLVGAHPGSPEAADTGEEGDRYMISITAQDGAISRIQRIAVNTVSVRTLDVDCTPLHAANDLLAGEDQMAVKNTYYRIRLRGIKNFPLEKIQLEQLRQKTYGLTIVEDATSPDLSVFCAAYAAEDSLRGEFFTLLEKRIADGSLPADLDRAHLSALLQRINETGTYTAEEWLC